MESILFIDQFTDPMMLICLIYLLSRMSVHVTWSAMWRVVVIFLNVSAISTALFVYVIRFQILFYKNYVRRCCSFLPDCW